jgi:hypothetical protein
LALKNGVEKLVNKPPASSMSRAIPDGATLVITHAELCSRHGTGALLLSLLREEPRLAVFHSQVFFEAHDIDVPAFHIRSGRWLHPERRLTKKLLARKKVRRILCVPFYESDVQTALTALACTGAPLTLYLMDDQNVHVNKIGDKPMKRLIQRANICLAISPGLCAAYKKKYQRDFWLAPPTADPDLFVPPDYHFKPHTPPRGILIGNLWSSRILSLFRETVRSSGLQLDWCGNAGKPFISLDPDELRNDGILLRSHLPETTLLELARAADFAVIPIGTLDGSDSHEWLARTSLPSRIVYLMTTANVPIIVMGHPETAAAQFVTNLGLGAVCSYREESFQMTVKRVTDPIVSSQIRQQARMLSPTFSSRNLASWLWDSMERGQAIDHRFEDLVTPGLNRGQTVETAEMSSHVADC